MEEAAVIAKSDTITWKIQSSKGIEKAGCKTSKTAIPKTWFWFSLFQFAHRLSIFLQDLFYIIVESQINQVVA